MAVPKKKSSRSRRNMRRYSAAYQLDPVAYSKDSTTGDVCRPHRVSREAYLMGVYTEKMKSKKADKKSGASKT